MIKAAFLVNSLSPSQKSVFLVSAINSVVSNQPNCGVCVFYRNISGKMVVTPLFAIMSEYEAWTFDGIAIATDIKSANTLLRCPGPVKKFFYVWEPEWVYKNLSYQEMSHVYQNENMPLIARSVYHHGIISKLWQKPITIIEEFNDEQITSFLNKTNRELLNPQG